MTTLPPCKCCEYSDSISPEGERPAIDSFMSRLHGESDASYLAREQKIYRRLSQHEAGHAIAAVAHGRGIKHATIGGGAPRVYYDQSRIGRATVDALAIGICSGVVTEGVLLPTWGTLVEAIIRAQDGRRGVCDECRMAEMIVDTIKDRSTRELVNCWYDTYDACQRLFASPEWSGALTSLSTALEARTLLIGDEIEEIVRPFDLAAPLKSLPPIW